MTVEAIEQQRQEIYEIAEAIAPTWERRRADVEEVSTPVRKCEGPSPAAVAEATRRAGVAFDRSVPAIAFARG